MYEPQTIPNWQDVSRADAVEVAFRYAGEAYDVTREEITGPRRWWELVCARGYVVEMLSRHGFSDSEIGRRIKRDRSSVRHLRETQPHRRPGGVLPVPVH